jgi:hypothetical protein
VFHEIKQYLNHFNTNDPSFLYNFIKTKNYSIFLIQIHQLCLSFLKEIKSKLSLMDSKMNYDHYFGTMDDLNTSEIIRKFNNEFFTYLLSDTTEPVASRDIHIKELIEGLPAPSDKYDILSIVLSDISSEALSHMYAEINKIKDANNMKNVKSRLKSLFSLYVLEDAIPNEDITINTNDVVTDGMFGKICLGTLKNADLYGASDAVIKKSTVHDALPVAVELIYFNENYLNKQRFGHELDSLKKLSNAKCVLKVYGWLPITSETTGTNRPVVGIVTETWDRTLTSLVLDETFEPTIDIWLKYLLEIIKALSHIKRSGITYRTMKADSIVITSANTAVISDLSLTFNQNYITTRTTVTNTYKLIDSTNQQYVGSIGFTAPEVYKGELLRYLVSCRLMSLLFRLLLLPSCLSRAFYVFFSLAVCWICMSFLPVPSSCFVPILFCLFITFFSHF